MPKIFICYRHDDTAYVVTTVTERLTSRFGADSVFVDVDAIPAGRDFREHIRTAVGECDVLLAFLGDRWLQVTDESGRPRLESATDYVRIELEAALERGVPVIPILVGAAQVPSVSNLPSSLSDLAFRQSVSIRSGSDFVRDLERLETEIERTSPNLQRARRGRISEGGLARAWPAGVLIGLLAMIGFGWWLLSADAPDAKPQADAPPSIDAIAIMTIDPTDEFDLHLGRYARGTLFAHLSHFAHQRLRVMSQEMLDWRKEEGGADWEIAKSLNLKWMISGTLSRFGDLLILRLNVVDTPGEELLETIERRVQKDDFPGFERIVNEASVQLLEVLHVEVSAADRRRLLSETSGASGETASDFLETMGFNEETEPVEAPPEQPQSGRGWSLVGAAHAAELQSSDTTRQEVLDLVERYRLAIQSKEIEGLAGVYVEMTPRLRASFGRYFGNARNLVVTFSNVEVEVSQGTAVATFTRRDEFEDERTGRPAAMEFRVTSICEETPEGWRIRGLLR